MIVMKEEIKNTMNRLAVGQSTGAQQAAKCLKQI